MKNLIEYTLKIKSKEDVTETLENGDKIIKSVEVEKPVKVVLKEPSRQETNKAREFYLVELSNALRAGILSRAVLDKMYRQNEGVLTESELKRIDKIRNRLDEIRVEYQKFPQKPEDQTDEEKTKINDLINEFTVITRDLEQLEEGLESLFSNSAESVAQSKQALWNVLFLSFIEKDGKLRPVVEGETLDERLDAFDKILEAQNTEDEKNRAALYNEILTRNGSFVNLLSKGKVEQSQLKELNDKIESGEIVL